MRIFIGLCVFTFTLYAQSILVLNSNAKVQRYNSMEKEFIAAIQHKVTKADITNMSQEEVQECLYDIYPDIIYAIGTKAYQYARAFVPEKKIFFSSIMNYKRFYMGKNVFGVSNELHAGMQLTLIKSLLSDTKSISMIYSRYTIDVYLAFKQEAKNVGIEIIAEKIDEDSIVDIKRLQSADVFMLLADPLLIRKEKKVEKLFKQMKNLNIPIVAYHPLYIEYGAVLILSVDTSIIGKQVAMMIRSHTSKVLSQEIQTPIGSYVIFNKALAKRMKLRYNKSALGIVNKVIK